MGTKHGEADFGCSMGEDTRLDNELKVLHDFGNTIKLARATVCTSMKQNEFKEKLLFISRDESMLIEFLKRNTVGKTPEFSKMPNDLHGYMQVNYFDKKTDEPKYDLYKYFLIEEREI